MGINPDLVGRIYPAGESYQVGREKIREFAAATKAANPAHYDVQAARKLGYSDVVAPPTFAVDMRPISSCSILQNYSETN